MSGRVLVTGATGLVGREVLRALDAGTWEVASTSRSPANLPRHHACDLSDPGAVRDLLAEACPEVIVHLAGGTAANRHELYRKNVLATVHLLESAAQLTERPYCLVFGSAAEYGDVSAEPIAESAPLRPVSDYGRAKAAQTAVAESLGRARGLPLTVLRPFNLVSPDLPDSSALGNLRRQLLASPAPRPAVECGRLDVVRDWVPIGFVAQVVRRLVEGPVPGRTLNVCSGVGIALGRVLAAMAERLGVQPRLIEKPELIARPAALRVVGDPAALRAATGLSVTPTPASLAELLLG